jgi:hypothetical protein
MSAKVNDMMITMRKIGASVLMNLRKTIMSQPAPKCALVQYRQTQI